MPTAQGASMLTTTSRSLWILLALSWAGITTSKYIDVCPTPGVTTGCKKIGYDDVDPTPPKTTVAVPSIYQSGKDYSDEWVAPPITGTPTKPINGETSTYTSYSQTTSEGVLLIFPIIIPIEPGVPIPPPEIPEEPGQPEPPIETLEPEQVTETDDPSPSTNAPSSSNGPAQYCTKPTPLSMSAPASTVTKTTSYGITPDDEDNPQPSATPNCKHTGVSNDGYDPNTLNTLAGQFCKDGMGSNKATLDTNSLDPKIDPKGISVDFSYNQKTGNCPASCKDSFANIIQSCQFNSHWIIGGGELDQGCGDYSFTINVNKPSSAAAPSNAGPTPPGTAWPTALSSTTACWSGDPGKHIHTSRVSEFISSQCGLVTQGASPPQTTFADTGFDWPDGVSANQAKLDTNLLLYAQGTKNIPDGDDCVKGFIGAIDCPGDSQGIWGGTKWTDGIQWSVWGTDHSSNGKEKRDALPEPQPIALPDSAANGLGVPGPSISPRQKKPRETRLYAYSSCPEAHKCAHGFAIADHYAFSGSVCDAEPSEVSFHPSTFVTGGSQADVQFKSFGHEGCQLMPGLGEGWGQIICGDHLAGTCQSSQRDNTRALECDDTKPGTVPKGTILKEMAVCSF